jgi:hypothetical protein
MSRHTFAAVALLASATACIPYTVGTTAQPLPRGHSSSTLSVFAMPSVGILDSSRGGGRTRGQSFPASDYEYRWGVDARSDIGLRTTSGSGLVINYKRLLSDTGTGSRVNLAVMPGAGFVNLGDHLHFELTLLASAHEPRGARKGAGGIDTTPPPVFVPYGGLRVMQVVPIAEGAVSDKPTAGGFFGVRIGSTDFGISPEIGVFYDHSALGVRRSDLVVVPAVSVHGNRLLDFLGGIFGRGGILRTERQRGDVPSPTEPKIPPTSPAPQPVATRPSSSRCAGPRVVPCRHPVATPDRGGGIYSGDATRHPAIPTRRPATRAGGMQQGAAAAQRLPVRRRTASW